MPDYFDSGSPQWQAIPRAGFVHDLITSAPAGTYEQRLNHVAPWHPDSGFGPPVPAPTFGYADPFNGGYSGLRVGPPTGAGIMVINELGNHPVAMIPAIKRDQAHALPVLPQREVALYHADGRALLYAHNNGATDYLRTPGGVLQIGVDAAGNILLTAVGTGSKVIITAPGGVTINGTALTVP